MNTQTARPATRRPGRPATYVFDKPDSQLSESERKLKSSIEKRRLRQNRSYHRRKALRAAQENGDASGTKGDAKATGKKHSEGPAEVPSLDPASQARHQLQQLHQQHLQQQQHTYGMPGPTASTVNPLAYSSRSLGLLGTNNGLNDFVLTNSSTDHLGRNTASATGAAHDLSGVSGATHVSGSIEKADSELDAASLAARWGLPPPAASPPSEKLMMLAGALPTSVHSDPLGFAIVPEGEQDQEQEEDDGTDALVQNALAAAEQTAQGAALVPSMGDLRGDMDQQRDLLRMAGIKDIVFDTLRTQFLGMPQAIQNALRHFVVFPESFDLRAASHISGIDSGQLVAVDAMMQHMVGANFVMLVKGRYQMNHTVKSFLLEDAAVAAIDPGDSFQSAMSRFRSYYREQLERFQDENIHKIGWRREQAMAFYDSERGNMQFAEFLSQRNSRMMLRDFLSAGITVMRYCVRAVEREQILLKALAEDAVSSETMLLKKEQNVLLSESDPETERLRSRDMANKARLQLALSEAYFDQLKIPQAEAALMRALSLMGGGDSNGVPAPAAAAGSGGRISSTGSIVDSVLVLLLLSNVRMASNRVKDARTLCVKALRILAAAGMGRSTFGINAMANLVAIYLEERHLDKASMVATRLVDTLNNMGYTGMPIFADALGVCGMVAMAQGRYRDAEQRFGSAVEIVRKWGAKEWDARPVQHCLDLDIWLLESLAAAIAKQGRADEASKLEATASDMRKERGLASNEHETDFFSLDDTLEPIAKRLRSAPRHLY